MGLGDNVLVRLAHGNGKAGREEFSDKIQIYYVATTHIPPRGSEGGSL